MKKILKLIGYIFVLVLGMQAVYSEVGINNIQFDPAIISSGDEVDIIIEYSSSNFADAGFIGDADYSLEVKLVADDDLTEKYITILDSYGDNLKGTVLGDVIYNKVFRVKVNADAVKSNYEFKLIGTWYKNGVKQDLSREFTFTMPVKREGIILDVSNILTTPTQVRPGDKYVEIKTNIENVGAKSAKSVKVDLIVDEENIIPSYSNNNRVWIGKLNSDETKEVTFHLNLDDYLKADVYNLKYVLTYLDLDDNSYSKEIDVPFLVKPRSYLEVISVEGSGLAGEKGLLKVELKNTGLQSAESIDVRILKDNSQPFEFDVRNNYVGELKPNETGVAIFEFDISSDASIKTHDFKLLIRSKGDSDEGDDTIYTYNRGAKFDVTGVAKNNYIRIGSVLLLLVLVVFGIKAKGNKK